MLAHGDEPGLASPLADAVLLAAAPALADAGPAVTGAVFGAGCDGELTPAEVLERLAEVTAARRRARRRRGSPETVLDALEAAIAHVPTEASAMAVRCARGETRPGRDPRRAPQRRAQRDGRPAALVRRPTARSPRRRAWAPPSRGAGPRRRARRSSARAACARSSTTSSSTPRRAPEAGLMSWVETTSPSFTARHAEEDADAVVGVLELLEGTRERLTGAFPVVPEGIAVVVHSTAGQLEPRAAGGDRRCAASPRPPRGATWPAGSARARSTCSPRDCSRPARRTCRAHARCSC